MDSIDEKCFECLRVAIENGTFGTVAVILIVAVTIWALVNTVFTTDLERQRIDRGGK